MKKLLSIILAFLAVITTKATETTLWEDTYTDGIEINSETISTFKAGDVLRVYATVPEGGANFKICYKGANNNWSETTIPSLGDNPGQWPWINYNPGYYEFTLTAEDISALSDMNIYIYKGDNSSITKVSLVTADTPSYEGTVIYNGGDVVMGTAWDKYISLSAENFTDLNANAVIRIYIKDVLDDVQAVFQDGEWQDIEGVDAVYPANTDTYYELTLNSSVLATVKEKGLIVKGKNFTVCAVSIMSTGTTVTTYTLNVTAENGSVTVKQGETDVTGTTTFAGGTELTLTANPSEGYIFEKWTIGETESTDNPLSVTMSEDKTIAAVFKDAKILDWNHEYSTGNTGLTDIRVNDRIQIVFTDESTLSSTDDIQIWQKDANWSGTQISSGTLTDKVYEFAVANEAMCTNIKERGLYIKGQNATFKELQVVKYYAVTITAPTNGTITIKNGDNVVNSGDYVPVNTSLTLTATPADDYSFAKWTIGSEESTENPHTLTITEATSIAATFTANAIPAFSLDGFAADENNTYNGETHALTTTSEWSGMQLWIGNNSTYNGSKLVVKTAEDCKLKITVGYVGEGQEELSDEAVGKSHAVTLDNTKKIQKVIIQNQEAGTVTFSSMELDPSYTLTILSAENGSLTVNDGTNNLASGASVAYGTTLTLTATPADDYSFAKWTIGGEESTENPHTLTITEATSIAATFTANAIPAFSLDGFAADENNTYNGETHALTTTSEWSGMQLWIGNNSTYNGSKLVVKTAEDCKLKITVGYVGEGQAELSDEAAGKSHAVTLDNTKKIQKVIIQNQEAGTVTFSSMELDPSYTLTILSAENGSFTVSDGTNDIANGASVAYGTSLTLTATPAEGYSFSKWVIGDAESTENPHTLTITEATSIAATFTANAIPAFSLDGFAADENNTYNGETHALTTTSGWSGMQLWIGNNSTYSGSKLVVKTAEDCKLKIIVGYVGEGQAELSDEAAGKSHAVTLDNTKKIQKVIIQNQEAGTVTFSSMELDPSYTLTILSAENGSFTVSDGTNDIANGASVAYGTSLTLTATPADDYSFAKWTIGSEESTENPHTITVTEATSIAATFSANPTISPVFTNGKADLGKLESQNAEKVTVSVADGKATVTTTEGWTGVQLTTTTADNVSGKELRITFAGAAKVKAYVKYSDETDKDSIMSEASTVLYLPIDDTKTVYQVQIQPTEATTLVISEIAVNAESTKPAEPVVTPVFTDGKADLSKLESQNAEKVTVSVADGKATVTTTEGWTGVQLTTTTADNVSGKELRITFAEAAKVKAYVKYSDETDKDSIMSEASTVLYLPIDDTKTVYQIQIQPTEATTLVISEIAVNAESTKPAEPVVTPVFTDGKADLSKLESQNTEKVTVSVADGKATVMTTEGWTGVQLTTTTADNVSGKELRITFAEAAKVKAYVKYSDETDKDSIMSEASTVLYLPIDDTKTVYQVQIQPTEATTLVISEIAVNAESTKPAEPEPTSGQTGVNISLTELNEGWNSTYDATSKTITTTGNWGARGWYIGDDRYNGKGSITVKFNAVEFSVTLKMEYTNTNDESRSVEAGAAAGETEVVLDIPDNVKTIEKVYITYQPAGTLALTEATVNDKVVDNRTEKTLVEKSQAIADGDIKVNRGLFSNAVAGDIIRIYGIPGEGAKIALEPADYSGALDGANWTAFEESPFALKLTKTVLNTVKEKGLLIRGENYNFTKAVLYTESDLGNEIEDEEPDPEPQEPDEPTKTGIDISLGGMNEGWSSTYDASTKTITTEGEWGARGWYVGDDRYNGKGSITVKFNAVDFPVTLKMEYTNTNDEKKDVTAGAASGETEVTLDIPANVKTIDKVYITYEPAGSLTLTDATVNDKVVDNRTEKTLVENTQAIADGDIRINRGLFSNAVAGDIIRIYGIPGEGAKIALEPADYSGALDGANWTAFEESPFALKLTETVLNTIKEKDLLVRGENYTFNKAVLYTEEELGKEIIDVKYFILTLSTPENGTVTIKQGGETVEPGEFEENTELTLTAEAAEGYLFTKWIMNGEDAGTEATLAVKMTANVTITAVFDQKPVTIIDEKTGEVNLSEMTAQDVEAATVTVNTDDHSITITTTQPYKAAQIWFNEPEEVRGNVLVVNIAEQDANVTVTVKYTDGTESSMTSTTTGAQRAAARLASTAGTQIVVPVDMGKKLQCIELKNALAGTLHVTKMVFTTQNVFTDGKANLSMAKAQSNATYDISTYTLATTRGWTGITITPLDSEDVSGAELAVRFVNPAQVKVAVTYHDGTQVDTITGNAVEEARLLLDMAKSIKQIQIQPTMAGVVQFQEVVVRGTVTPEPQPEVIEPLTEGESRTLWADSEGEELNWNEICKSDGLYGAILREGQQIVVTISSRDENCEWPKVILRDAQSNEASTVELNTVRRYPYTVRLTLTADMVEQLRDGFCISGDGITVTSISLYQPLPPQPGDINLIELNGGWNSTYDAERHIITTTSRWGACGWNIGDDRYNGMNLIQIGFEAVDFPVTLKMEYVDANGKKQATSAGIAAGRTTVELEIPEGIRQIDKVYLIWQQPGSITLTSAEVSSTKAEALGIDLSLFDPMGEKVSYDKQTYTMTTEEGYAGIQLWLGDANAIESPMLLELKTAGETAKLRVTVGYTDGTEASVDGEGANIQMELDDLRSIQKIMIQNMEAGTVTFNSLNITVRMPNGANAPAWNYIPVSGEGTYTVNGTKVSALTKGLYIMDGKKIVIK